MSLLLQTLGLTREASRGTHDLTEGFRAASLARADRGPATLRVALDASKSWDLGTVGSRMTTITMAQTTLDEWAKDPVDPEIRAHVYSLITAVCFHSIAPLCSMFANACTARWYW